jgi:CRISPR-associated protein Cmr5
MEGIKMQTQQQKLAQKAFACIDKRKPSDEYQSFSKSFPALIQTCGLAQALAFAEGKAPEGYLDDLVFVICETSPHSSIANFEELSCRVREVSVSTYLKLTRDVMSASSWIKRYAESLAGGK